MPSHSGVPHFKELRAGMSVLDINAHPVGRVTEILQRGFKIRTLAGETVDLRRDIVFSVGKDRVTLLCGRERLLAWVLPSVQDDPAGAEPPR